MICGVYGVYAWAVCSIDEHASKPVKHLAFYSSLKSLLSNPDLGAFLEALEDDKRLPASSIDEFFYRILVNLWNGIAQINPDAAAEPRTTVLWGSIGVNAVHLALTPVLISVLDSATPDLTTRAFMSLTKASHIADYAFWYTRQGSARPKEAYPGSKGQAPTMTGAAGYARVAKILENEWRAALHSSPKKLHVKV